MCACCVHSAAYRLLRCSQRAQGIKSAHYQCLLGGMKWVDVDTTTLFVDTVSDIVPKVPAGLDSFGIPIIIC